MDRVAVVILNWNGRHLMERFLPSVIQFSKDASVVVADNASSDDSVEWLGKRYPQIRVIRHSKNLGFTEGYNQALKEVNAKHYVLLNSDVEVTEGWLDHMLAKMEEDSTIAACQPKLLKEAERTQFEYAGAGGGYIDRYGFPFCRGRIFQSIERDHGQFDDQVEVFWASGACMMIRSELFHQSGGFDASFFAHMEEIDLCWRLKRMGYTIWYVGTSTVYHVGGATLQTNSPRKTYLNFRNNLSMMFKNLPARGLFRSMFIKMVLDGIASVKFFAEGHVRSAWAVFRAHVYFYSHLSTLKRNRREVREISEKEEVSAIYNGSVVVAHYGKRKHRFKDLDQDRMTAS
ncbi:MAG: glycosyltransferase family 2 protein [Flavobacteriales bacterium]|nr:glycosyltransferase family 2 protein [Flavobacteriales bacterium]